MAVATPRCSVGSTSHFSISESEEGGLCYSDGTGGSGVDGRPTEADERRPHGRGSLRCSAHFGFDHRRHQEVFNRQGGFRPWSPTWCGDDISAGTNEQIRAPKHSGGRGFEPRSSPIAKTSKRIPRGSKNQMRGHWFVRTGAGTCCPESTRAVTSSVYGLEDVAISEAATVPPTDLDSTTPASGHDLFGVMFSSVPATVHTFRLGTGLKFPRVPVIRPCRRFVLAAATGEGGAGHDTLTATHAQCTAQVTCHVSP